MSMNFFSLLESWLFLDQDFVLQKTEYWETESAETRRKAVMLVSFVEDVFTVVFFLKLEFDA